MFVSRRKNSVQHGTTAPPGDPDRLRQAVAEFQTPALPRSLWQLANSFGGFFACCAAMYALNDISYGFTLALAPFAAGFLVRIFIIQHDCGHRAFFRSQRANALVGFACSLLTMAPFASWRRQHAGHHGVWNDLDRRQSGADIYSSCLTLAEYRALGRRHRWWYRITRHPIVANLLLPPLIFVLLYRLPFDMPKSWRRERLMVHVTSLTIVALLGTVGLLFGYGTVAAVQTPVIVLATIAGVGLFAVQHRGAQIRWARHDAWDPVTAAVQGSTYLRLPRLAQWFTGSIGFHHVHHLNPRVPNYRLEECHERVAALHDVPMLSFGDVSHALRYILWDEESDRMTTIGEAERRATPLCRQRSG